MKGIEYGYGLVFQRDKHRETQQLTFAGITATERMALFGALKERLITAQNLAKHRGMTSAGTTVAEREMQLGSSAKEEGNRIALENA